MAFGCAVEAVDAIGGEEQAKSWLAEKDPALKDLPVQNLPISDPEDDSRPTGRAFSWLFNRIFNEKTQISERVTLDGLVSVWHPNLRP